MGKLFCIGKLCNLVYFFIASMLNIKKGMVLFHKCLYIAFLKPRMMHLSSQKLHLTLLDQFLQKKVFHHSLYLIYNHFLFINFAFHWYLSCAFHLTYMVLTYTCRISLFILQIQSFSFEVYYLLVHFLYPVKCFSFGHRVLIFFGCWLYTV